ncbi:MAG: DoxX family protein [Sphingobacteriales bacterium]|nr:DoxX family protein [Sphingobacteriales bacterium]
MGKFFSASPAGQPGGIALVRVITGVLLLYHGWECFDAEKMKMYTGWFSDRHYTQPALWAYTGKVAELLAGAGFVLGLFTRLAALGVIAAFTGIIFILGDKGKIFQGDQHPFLFILLSLVFLFTGPGALSLDRLIFKNKGRRY